MVRTLYVYDCGEEKKIKKLYAKVEDYHSHEKQKDSLETTTAFVHRIYLNFNINLEFRGLPE